MSPAEDVQATRPRCTHRRFTIFILHTSPLQSLRGRLSGRGRLRIGRRLRREGAVLFAEDPPRAGELSVYQRPVDVVVNARVARIDNVLVVRGLHQIAVAERLGREIFGFKERSKRVVVVADYQYRYASTIGRLLNGWGGELVVVRADIGASSPPNAASKGSTSSTAASASAKTSSRVARSNIGG